jgi:hypothetical protein
MEVLKLTYVGTMNNYYNIDGLLTAIDKIKEKLTIKLIFVGSLSEDHKERIKSSISSYEFIPTVLHPEAIKYMVDSDILLLVLPADRTGSPGKTFEYIRAHKPVLLISKSEDSDAEDILSTTGSGRRFHPDDVEGMAYFLATMTGFDYCQHCGADLTGEDYYKKCSCQK